MIMSGKLTREDVQEILTILDGSSFDELKIEMGDLKISLSRSGSATSGSPFAKTFEQVPATETPVATRAPIEIHQAHSTPHANGVEIAAPMLGVFFRAPRPGADPYIQAGSRITAGTIVGIIEVMKFMNAVPAGVAGEVVEILAPDGQLVEFGQTLVRVRPDAS
jgi:acetyl-CoA carboxylase biotin carboxyl carrier protein